MTRGVIYLISRIVYRSVKRGQDLVGLCRNSFRTGLAFPTHTPTMLAQTLNESTRRKLSCGTSVNKSHTKEVLFYFYKTKYSSNVLLMFMEM